MFKKVIGIATAVALALPVAAFASVTFDGIAPVVFDAGNGWEASVDGSAGDTFRAKAVVDVTSDDDVNSLSWDYIGDFLPLECVQLDSEQTQTISNLPVEFDMKFPANPGSYDVQFKVYGVDGAGQDFNCTDGNARDTQNVNDQIVVNVGNNNNSGNTGGGSGNTGNVGALSQLQALVASLAAQVQALLHPVTPPANTVCQEYLTLASGLSKGSDTRGQPVGGRVGKLQSFLMYKGYDIAWLSSATNGAPYGYYGDQTNGAAIAFRGANSCI